MEENKKSAPPKKNCGYGLLDRIMCGDADRWGDVMCGAAAKKRCAPTFNSLSDSGVRRAIEAIEGIALRGWRRQGHAFHTML